MHLQPNTTKIQTLPEGCPSKLYRVDGVLNCLHVEEFTVLGETPCGWWIDVDGDRKWVSKTGRKRRAYPTVKQALKSFRCRKTRQIRILKTQLESAQLAKGLSESLDSAMSGDNEADVEVLQGRVYRYESFAIR